MKIKTKIIFGFGSILLICGIILNISISSVLNEKMETTVKESLTQLMSSTSESIKYRISLKSTENNDSKFINESSYLVKYISLNYDCTLQIRNNNGSIIADNTENLFASQHMDLYHSSKNGSAEVYILYKENTLYGLLSYPIYIDGTKLGTLNICKEYNDLYSSNNTTTNLITIIECMVFLSIFLIAYFIVSKIINPIVLLTKGVKRIENGDYNFHISIKGNDEVSILSKEFIIMKDQIQSQIDTINKEKEKVEILEKHRKEFFDNVTHELKTPLTAITGYAEMLKDNMIEDITFRDRAIERIYLESQRITGMVLDLINISKGNSHITEAFIICNIKNLISDTTKDMQIKANKYNIKIEADLLDHNLLVQKNRIEQLFINLLDNAIKYSTNNIIKISSYILDNNYIIEIINYSTPIPQKIYDNIFNPFVKTTTSYDESSSGLGLYISKEIITDHNGTISIINGDIIIVKVSHPL